MEEEEFDQELAKILEERKQKLEAYKKAGTDEETVLQ